MALKTSEQGRDGSFLKGKALDLKIKTISPGQLAHSWVFDRPLSAQLSFAPSLMSTLRRNCMTKRLQRLGTLNQRATLFFLAGKRTVFKLCPCELPGSIWVPTFLTCKLTTLLMLPLRQFPEDLHSCWLIFIPGLWPPPSPVPVLHSPLLGLFSTVTTSWGSPSLRSLPESYYGWQA